MSVNGSLSSGSGSGAGRSSMSANGSLSSGSESGAAAAAPLDDAAAAPDLPGMANGNGISWGFRSAHARCRSSQ